MRTIFNHHSLRINLIQLILIGLAAAAPLFAQPVEHKEIEVGLSGSFNNFIRGDNFNTVLTFLLSPRIGFFIEKGLELEPECILMLGAGSDPVYILNGNVSYNIAASKRSTPFILIGYGLANRVPFFNPPFTKNDFTAGVLNVGIGVKMFPEENTAIRMEYRFQNFTGDGEPIKNGSTPVSSHIEVRIYSVQIGLSVFI